MATKSMQGNVCLVTGSSSGMDLVTARELASMGATVVLLQGIHYVVFTTDERDFCSISNSSQFFRARTL